MTTFSNNKSTEEILNEFRNSFTTKQLGGILGFLVLVMRADGKIHPKESDYFSQMSRYLGINESNFHTIPRADGIEQMTIVLDTLNNSQKEWLVTAMHGMMLADGHIDEREVAFILETFKRIGISYDQYKEILKKDSLLIHAFNS